MMMRVVTIVLGILLAGAASAAAQPREFGFKVGPTFASLDFGMDSDYDTKVSVGGGVFGVLPLNERIAVQLEGLFRPSGASQKLEIDDFSATSKLLLNYFEVPTLVRVTATRSASRSFYVFAGPSFAMKLSAKLESSSTGGGFTSGTLDDIGEDIKRFEVGAVAGAGVNIGRHLVVDGRYTWGLTKINETSPEESLKNRALTFLVGYRF